jgi:hypothetical protein
MTTRGSNLVGMSNLEKQPNAPARWIDFDHRNPETHPKDGSEIFVKVAGGLRGPATYRSRSGFALFKAPWMDLGPVEQWLYVDWSKWFKRTTLPL